jgi:PleD family two-component response regulator
LIAREQARMRREQRPITVVAFDVGPAGRDAAPLSNGSVFRIVDVVAETLAEATRAADVAVRWTPDQLLLLLPGLAAVEARPVAERVRAAMQAAGGRRLAVSGGIVEMLPEDSLDSAVERAQKQLQVARDRGHNRIA